MTFWEISLKFALGKLTLENCTPESLVGVARFHQLPRVPHRDRFDRMLVWQALQRKLVLIARDAALPAYAEAGLETLW